MKQQLQQMENLMEQMNFHQATYPRETKVENEILRFWEFLDEKEEEIKEQLRISPTQFLYLKYCWIIRSQRRVESIGNPGDLSGDLLDVLFREVIAPMEASDEEWDFDLLERIEEGEFD